MPDTLPIGIDCSSCWRTAFNASSFIGRPRIALQGNYAGPSTHCWLGDLQRGLSQRSARWGDVRLG
jgi:hypothetical protein